MDYPNLTVVNNQVVKITSVEVNIPIESSDENISFISSSSHIIFLAINQNSIKKIYSYDDWEKNLFLAIYYCRELTDIQKCQFERWSTYFISFNFKTWNKATKNETNNFISDKKNQLFEVSQELQKKKIIEKYEHIRDSNKNLFRKLTES